MTGHVEGATQKSAQQDGIDRLSPDVKTEARQDENPETDAGTTSSAKDGIDTLDRDVEARPAPLQRTTTAASSGGPPYSVFTRKQKWFIVFVSPREGKGL